MGGIGVGVGGLLGFGLCDVACAAATYGAAFVLLPLLLGLPQAWPGIMADYQMLKTDPAFDHPLEALFAYPGLWALWLYRLSHVLWRRDLPWVSRLVPRFAMAMVRYATAVDIHPAAKISEGGVMLDHAAGVVIGATAEVGARTIFYHQVTLGSSGKPTPAGERRHPIVGDDCVLGAGAKILGAITLGNGVVVGANSVVTKDVPKGQIIVGIPARAICADRGVGVDTNAEAISILHHRLTLVELLLQGNGNNLSCSSRPPSRSETPSHAGAASLPQFDIPTATVSIPGPPSSSPPPPSPTTTAIGSQASYASCPGALPSPDPQLQQPPPPPPVPVIANRQSEAPHPLAALAAAAVAAATNGGGTSSSSSTRLAAPTPRRMGRSASDGGASGFGGPSSLSGSNSSSAKLPLLLSSPPLSPPALPPASASSPPSGSPYNTVVGGFRGGAQEERVQELLHARQMAREIDMGLDSSDGDKKKSALARHWARLSRKQGGFQGLHAILQSVTQETDASLMSSGL